MRLALISDIHGHHTALESVLADIRQQRVDSVICLGDVATIGPQPRQVLDALKTLNCVCITGNHDAALLNLEAASALQIAPPLLPTLQWCAQQLTEGDFAFLRSFMPAHEAILGGAAMLCYHGTPQSNCGLILATTPAEELDALLAGRAAAVMAGGHSHIQMLRQHNGRLVINPGSVGSAFSKPPLPGTIPSLLPWAEYAIVGETDGRLSVELRRVPFDIAAFREAVARSDLPLKNWWLQQYSTEG